MKKTSWLIAGSPGKENRRLSDTPPSNAPLRLDQDALRLLEAIHRGCVVRLDDGEGLRWHVEPRVVVPMRLYDEDEITLVDLDSDEMLSSVVAGPRRHMPDWPLDRPHVRLGAGILLIRNALAVRKGIMLSATQTGRALAASRIGDGADIAGRPAAVDPAVVPPIIEISDETIDMAPFAVVEAEQRVTVLPSLENDAVLLRFDAGGRRLEATLTRLEVDRTFETLDQAVEQRTRCLVQMSETTRLLKGGRTERIEVEVIQDFERGIVALRGSDVALFVTAVRRALDNDLTTVLQPIAVAYGRFDAVLSERTSSPTTSSQLS